ncbi:MAG: PEP-CTERM sorting domain-containing protein, partial [Pirellula sp.]
GSGTYRLYYDHSDTNKYTQAANATNLDILFTFKSEDGGGGGGVVPEPSLVAVFGLLSLGSAVAKWRRKRSQLAA